MHFTNIRDNVRSGTGWIREDRLPETKVTKK